MAALRQVFGEKTEETIVGCINAEIIKPKSSLLSVSDKVPLVQCLP